MFLMRDNIITATFIFCSCVTIIPTEVFPMYRSPTDMFVCVTVPTQPCLHADKINETAGSGRKQKKRRRHRCVRQV